MADGSEVSNSGSAMSVVRDHGVGKGPCGYCKAPGPSSISHGLWAFNLTVDDYQELLDRGWRRSGCYLYRPDMGKTCCPSYTIRLKASDFVPSKEQARVLKKMRRFLDRGIESERMNSTHVKMHLKNEKIVAHGSYNSSSRVDDSVSHVQDKELCNEDICIKYLSDVINDAVNICTGSLEMPPGLQVPKATLKKVKNKVKKKLLDEAMDLVYASGISFQIAALLRHSNIESASIASEDGHPISPIFIAEKLASRIVESGELSGFCVKACSGHLNFYTSKQLDSKEEFAPKGSHRFHSKAKGDIIKDKKHCKPSTEISGGHRLEIRMNRSSFDPVEYALYRKYQIMVHNDKPEKVTESSYRKFLVDTPLIFQSADSNINEIPSCEFGSFHQQYLIDGRLVAVGVVDILPRCLSSKYLFWDPDYAFLSPGKYSALMEIHWVREAEINCPSIQYYYLGYYIHSCSKMRYKAAYSPSELLCPLRYQWVPYHIAKPLLDRKPYVVLSDFANARNIEPSRELPQHSTIHEQGNNSDGVDSKKYFSDENEEMELDHESEFYPSNEWDSESASVSQNGDNIVDISKVVLGVSGYHLGFQELEHVFGAIREESLKLLKLQLQQFVSDVGDKLGARLVYKL